MRRLPMMSRYVVTAAGVVAVFAVVLAVLAGTLDGLQAVEVGVLAAALVVLLVMLHGADRASAATLRSMTAATDHAASHDELTGLPNRVELIARLRSTFASLPDRDEPAGLLLLDLDRFKEVNDTLGHPAGDELLRHVARRLRESLHAGDTLARLGGDEFAVLLSSIGEAADAVTVANRLARTLDAPFHPFGVEVSIGTSIGVCVAPDQADDATAMLKHADMAMYAAKRAGVEVAAFDATDTDDPDVERLSLLGGLRRAIEEDELVLHYQPQLDLASGRIIAVEALVRWQHPTRGLLGPGLFIDLAEQSGLMGPLTTWVLESAASQLGVWRSQGIDLAIAVNVSPRTLVEPGFAGRIFTSLARWQVDPSRLELEITEHELVEEFEAVRDTLTRVRQLGVRVAIDDFGTGYSSMQYLTELPADVLKIDRSLVASFTEHEAQATVLRSVSELAHALGFVVVAEGIEDELQVATLHHLGVDIGQGFGLWRPAPAEAVTAMLVDNRDDRPTSPTTADTGRTTPPVPPPPGGAATTSPRSATREVAGPVGAPPATGSLPSGSAPD